MRVRRFLFVCLLVQVSFGLQAAPPDDLLDEIIVSADFRKRSILELPATISVIDARTIDGVAVSHFEEISHLVPNLNFAGGSNRPRYFQIRGVGERSQYEGAPNPSVGFLIDGVDFSAIGGVALSWDIDQIEVLRGPQGTRFGANAIAGLINVQSKDPGDSLAIDTRLVAGGDDLRIAAIAAGGPSSENGALRVSAYSLRADGFRDNFYLGSDDSNGRDESELRLKYLYSFSDELELSVAAFYVDADNGYDAFALANDLTTYSDRPGRDAQRSVAGALNLDWRLPDSLNLTSITAAARSDIRFDFDADWGNEEFWSPYVYDFTSERSRIRETISQEVRLRSDGSNQRFNWLTGVYIQKLREDLKALDEGVYGDPLFGNFSSSTSLDSDYRATSSALFAEADFAASERTELSAGLRVEKRDADYRDSNSVAVSPVETMLGGHAGIRFAFDEMRSIYARVSRGYKAGGFNLGNVPSGRREFDAEFVTSMELGLNARLLSDAMLLRAAVFVDRRGDQQISTSAQVIANDPSSFVFFIDNAASGNSSGLELETQWILGDQLDAYLNIGILKTEVSTGAANPTLDGRDQAHAPGYTFAAGLSYRHSTGFFARVDVSGKDDFYFSNGHNQKSQAYELLNARLGYARNNLTISLWGRNLGDERYAVRGFFFGNEPPDFPDTNYIRLGDPRQIGVSLDWSIQ